MGAAIGIIVVVACAAFYVVTRGRRTGPMGAFRNRPSGDGGFLMMTSDRDPDADDSDSSDSGDSGDSADAGDSGGGGDGGGGDGGGGE